VPLLPLPLLAPLVAPLPAPPLPSPPASAVLAGLLSPPQAATPTPVKQETPQKIIMCFID
jgi:hypothetical protein